ncbi:hypothetical protein ACLOJK_014838 [Asimina triloba]
MEAGDMHLQKFSADASIWHFSDQVTHAWEETSRLLSKLNIVKVERDEAFDNATATRDEASLFSTKLVTFRSEAEALLARDADPDVKGKISRVELEVVQVTLLGLREAEILAKSEVVQAKVVHLRAELEASWADLEPF